MTMNSAHVLGLTLLIAACLQASPVDRDERVVKYLELAAMSPAALAENHVDLTDEDDDKVTFLLYTKETVSSPVSATVDEEGTLFSGALDVSKPVKVVIHGWLDHENSKYADHMIKAYLHPNSSSDVSVIFVHWSQADTVFYPYSVTKVPIVGGIVAKFLDRLVSENGLELSSVHIVGHSLGAHVAGVAGSHVTSGKVGKITGLDPALPLFSVGGENTLSTKAADFVNIVHTCGNLLGIFTAIGHADFYANEGTAVQPGCSWNLACSHDRAFAYYAEAIINSKSFEGTECANWASYQSQQCNHNNKVFLGENTDPRTRGTFFFKTAGTAPYGLGPKS